MSSVRQAAGPHEDRMAVSRDVAIQHATNRIESRPRPTLVDLERLRSSTRVCAWFAIGGWWILWRAVGLSADTAGLLIANLALLVALVALYELVRVWTDERTARRAAVYAAIFPVGYVFSMVYPEAVVLAGMSVAGVLAARGRWTGA